MSTTPNLLISYVQPSQNNKETTLNQALVEFDGAITNLLAITMADADVTLTTGEGNQALGNAVFNLTGTNTTSRNVIVPVNKKFYVVANNTSGGHAIVVKTPSGTGITVANAGGYVLLYCDGTNVVSVGAASGGATIGSVATKSADYLVLSGDSGNLLVLTAGSHTFTLPATAPAMPWFIFIECASAASGGTLVVSRNGLDIDGIASDVTITTNEGVLVFSDGSNYWTVRGIGGSGGSSTLAGLSDVQLSGLADGDLLTYTASASKWENKPASGGGGGTAFQSEQRDSRIIADGTTTSPPFQLAGMVLTIGGSPSAVAASSSKGAAIELPTAAAFFSRVSTEGAPNYVPGRHIKFLFKGYLTTTGDNSSWIAITDQPNTGNWTNGFGKVATPGASSQCNYVGFRCFNRAGFSLETTWQAACGDTTSDTIVDTSVTQDTSEHTFCIIMDDDNSQVLFYIDGVLKATITTHLPSAGALMAMFISEYVASTACNLGVSYAKILSDK